MEPKVLITTDAQLLSVIFNALEEHDKRRPTPAAPSQLDAVEKPVGVKEAAEYLGLSTQAVYANIHKLPHTKRFGKLYFFPSKLQQYVEAGPTTHPQTAAV
jgi:hypothetical protein